MKNKKRVTGVVQKNSQGKKGYGLLFIFAILSRGIYDIPHCKGKYLLFSMLPTTTHLSVLIQIAEIFRYKSKAICSLLSSSKITHASVYILIASSGIPSSNALTNNNIKGNQNAFPEKNYPLFCVQLPRLEFKTLSSLTFFFTKGATKKA